MDSLEDMYFSALLLDVSHSWQGDGSEVETTEKQPNGGNARTVCSVVRAINLLLIFLGHMSAGNLSLCSNLSAHYVTHNTLACTLWLSGTFHPAYGFHELHMNGDRTCSRTFPVQKKKQLEKSNSVKV